MSALSLAPCGQTGKAKGHCYSTPAVLNCNVEINLTSALDNRVSETMISIPFHYSFDQANLNQKLSALPQI